MIVKEREPFIFIKVFTEAVKDYNDDVNSLN